MLMLRHRIYTYSIPVKVPTSRRRISSKLLLSAHHAGILIVVMTVRSCLLASVRLVNRKAPAPCALNQQLEMYHPLPSSPVQRLPSQACALLIPTAHTCWLHQPIWDWELAEIRA